MKDKDLEINEEASIKQVLEDTSKKSYIKMFGKYLIGIWLNFKESFKYNPMKLPALFIAIPGLLLGFFLNFHYNVVVQLTFFISYTTGDVYFPGMPFDYSAIVLFALMLFGILNIFSAISMSGKKNKGSVIMATILSSFILVFGIAYLYAIIYFLTLIYSGQLALVDFVLDLNYMMCFVSVGGSIIFSIIGCILGWLKYDRNYIEVDR